MGVDYSLCLLIEKKIFRTHLEMLEPYTEVSDTPERNSPDPIWWTGAGNESVQGVLGKIEPFLERITTSEPEALDQSNLAKCLLKRGDSRIILWFTPWMQQIFQLTGTGDYLLITLELSMPDNLDFIPYNFPDLPFVWEVLSLLQPIYAWTEGEWMGSPHEEVGEEAPTKEAPWHWHTLTQTFGEQLRQQVEVRLNVPLTESGLHDVRVLPGDLTWITALGSVVRPVPYSYIDQDSQVWRTHAKAIERLRRVLKAIPATALSLV